MGQTFSGGSDHDQPALPAGSIDPHFFRFQGRIAVDPGRDVPLRSAL